MKFILNLLISVLLISPELIIASTDIDSLTNDFLEDRVNRILEKNLDSTCDKFASLPEETCAELVTAGAKSSVGLNVDMDALKESIKKPELLNSILLKAYGNKIPLSLEFKLLDSKDGENVLGITYSIDYALLKKNSHGQGSWNERTELTFLASGTIANSSKRNPRNFLDTRLILSSAYTTRIPQQKIDFAEKLTDASFGAAQACDNNTARFSEETCAKAREKALSLLDSSSDFLHAFQRYELGIDIGIESDQAFDASQTKYGIFTNGQYESWGANTLFGSLGLTPAFRLAVDGVNPGRETYRALVGDASLFYRIAAEISLWMPVGTYLNKKIVFALNYRNYSEISPSSIVKAAGLQAYSLWSISLSTPSGLFASYSSGELPLDQASDDVLELGWKTYF